MNWLAQVNTCKCVQWTIQKNKRQECRTSTSITFNNLSMSMQLSWKSTRNFPVLCSSLLIKQSNLKLTIDLLLPPTTIHGNVSYLWIHSGGHHFIKNWYHEGEILLLGSAYTIPLHISTLWGTTDAHSVYRVASDLAHSDRLSLYCHF